MTSLLNDAKRTWSAKSKGHPKRPGRWKIVVLLTLALGPVRASNAAPKYGNSLDWVPADAVFYSASLRLREQYDIVVQSNAFKKLAEMPAVQMGIGFGQMTWYCAGGPG